MYGMVNKAIEELIRDSHGDEAWEEVKRRAEVDVEAFLSHKPYPDEITYRLVEAASAHFGTPASEILFAFGEHWVLHTARTGYGALMEARNLPEFLDSLPHFHTRVGMIFPKLAPPAFEVTNRTVGSLRLHYRSHRPGLSRFVVGLLSGLGKKFGQPVRVTHAERKEDGADHDEFLVTWD